jgi:hypothetical protein
MSINLSALMKQRYDTAANWTAQNPTLLAGEIGIESDTKKWKVGTGSTAWTSLVYAIGGTYPIVNADIAAAAAIVDTKLATIATAGKVSNSATTAASANTASAIVARDASGNFTAGTITAALTGAASSNVLKAGDTMTGVLAVTAGTAALPGIAVSGDLNTGIYSPGADQIGIATGGTVKATIDSSGRLLVGTSSARTTFYNGGTPTEFQVEGDGEISVTRNANDSFGGSIILGKSRSTANTILSSGDIVGNLSWQGNDGTDFVEAASIKTEIDGTPGANDMPGRLVFSTTPDGGSSPTSSPPAMTINSGQEVLIGYSTDNGAYKLQVNSQIFATSATIATSDGRYKENVASLGGCLDLVKALRPVSFTWKPQQDITRTDDEGNEVMVRERHNFPEGTQVGFIAQEVQEVLADKPWLNSVIKENVRPAVLDNEDSELAPEEQFFGIAEGNLIAVLTNALQEAVAQIETLTDRVAALEAS